MFNDPVAHVQWVPLDKVSANDYNPNVVAPNELRLLYHSILMDGYTQPVVTLYDVIDKSVNERMASTVRHNRARGKHQVTGMAGIVFSMLDNGMNDASICNELGLEADELIRLKYVTGFAKLFEDVEYKKSWESRRQIRLRRDYVENAGK